MYKKIEGVLNDILKFKVSKEKVDKFNFYSIAIYMFLMMIPRFLYEIVKDYGIENIFYTIVIIFMIPFIYIFIYNIKNKYHKNSFDFILMSLYLLIVFISMMLSDNPFKCFEGSFGRKDGFITLISYYLIYVNSRNINKSEDVIKVIKIFFVYVIIGTIYAFIDAYLPETFITTKAYAHMGYGLSANPNFFGTYTMMFSIIGLTICLFKENSNFFIACTIISYIGLLLGESTGPFASFVFVLIYLLFYTFIKRKDLINKMIIWLSIFVSLYAIINYSSVYVNRNIYHLDVDERSTIQGNVGSVFVLISKNLFNLESTKINNKKELDFIISNRFEVWESVWKRTLDDHNLLLGCGIDNLSIYRVMGVDENKSLAFYKIDKAHNVYLNIIAETGIISLIIYLVWIVYIHIKAIKSKNKLVHLLLIAFIGYNIQAIFNINVIYVMPYYYIFSGIIIGLSEGDKNETGEY